MALSISQRHNLRTVRSTRSNGPTKERHPANQILCISQRHSLRTIRSTRSNEPTKERHPKNKKTHQRNTSWMRRHQMPSSVSIAKSGLSYRIRRHCVERSFLFWLPRSTPSTSVQSILDFRPPQTICHCGFEKQGPLQGYRASRIKCYHFSEPCAKP